MTLLTVFILVPVHVNTGKQFRVITGNQCGLYIPGEPSFSGDHLRSVADIQNPRAVAEVKLKHHGGILFHNTKHSIKAVIIVHIKNAFNFPILYIVIPRIVHRTEHPELLYALVPVILEDLLKRLANG